MCVCMCVRACVCEHVCAYVCVCVCVSRRVCVILESGYRVASCLKHSLVNAHYNRTIQTDWAHNTLVYHTNSTVSMLPVPTTINSNDPSPS